MSGFTSNITNTSNNLEHFQYIIKSVKVNLIHNKLYIEDHYIEQITKVLYGFCGKIYPNVKNQNSRYALYCSDDWIIENVIEFFANLPNKQKNIIMEDILEQNAIVNKQHPNNKNILLRKITLSEILDEKYDEEIAKYDLSMKKNNKSVLKKKDYDNVKQAIIQRYLRYKMENQFINPNKNKFKDIDFSKISDNQEQKYIQYLQDINAKYKGNMEEVNGGRSRKRLNKRKRRTKKNHGK